MKNKNRLGFLLSLILFALCLITPMAISLAIKDIDIIGNVITDGLLEIENDVYYAKENKEIYQDRFKYKLEKFAEIVIREAGHESEVLDEISAAGFSSKILNDEINLTELLALVESEYPELNNVVEYRYTASKLINDEEVFQKSVIAYEMLLEDYDDYITEYPDAVERASKLTRER